MQKLRAVLTTAAVLFAVACSDSPTEPSDVLGTYHLQTVNDAVLPVTVYQDADYRLEVLASNITLNSDLTYSFTSQLRETENGVPATFTESEIGTWTLNGSTVVLRDTQNFTTSAHVQGSSMVIEESGLRLVFAR